jgi:hypothetical protein
VQLGLSFCGVRCGFRIRTQSIAYRSGVRSFGGVARASVVGGVHCILLIEGVMCCPRCWLGF